MKTKMKFWLMGLGLFFMGLFIQINLQAQSGPWCNASGELHNQFQISYNPSNSMWVNEAERSIGYPITDITLQGYFRYGVTQEIDLTVIVPFKVLKTKGNNALAPHNASDFEQIFPYTYSSFGNISLIATRGSDPCGKVLTYAANLKVDLLTSSLSRYAGLRTGYGTWGVAPFISLGTSNGLFHVCVDGGVDFRFKGPDSANYANYFINGQFGVDYKDILSVTAQFGTYKGMITGERPERANDFTGLYPYDQYYSFWGVKILNEIDKDVGWGVSFRSYVQGHHITSDPVISVFFYFKGTGNSDKYGCDDRDKYDIHHSPWSY